MAHDESLDWVISVGWGVHHRHHAGPVCDDTSWHAPCLAYQCGSLFYSI